MLRRRLTPHLAAVALLLSACAGGSAPGAGATSGSVAPPTTGSTPPSAFPVTIGNVAIPARPERIVSLSPTATEMLFAIGAGSQVVAVDDRSDYPPDAPTTKLSGFQPNVEAIAGYAPDLVVVSNDPGGLVKSLVSLHVPTLVEPAAANLHGTYDQIDQIGLATGHADEAAALVATMRSKIAAIVASVPKPSPPLRVYHELDDTDYSATSQTFVGRVYQAFGLQNIADDAPAKAGDYPQLSSEFIVSEDPDLIVLADTRCCGQSAQTVAARPGWSNITAVRDGGVVQTDDDVVSRWGPRVVDFYRSIARAVLAAERAA